MTGSDGGHITDSELREVLHQAVNDKCEEASVTLKIIVRCKLKRGRARSRAVFLSTLLKEFDRYSKAGPEPASVSIVCGLLYLLSEHIYPVFQAVLAGVQLQLLLAYIGVEMIVESQTRRLAMTRLAYLILYVRY